jgi:hypothetical protein
MIYKSNVVQANPIYDSVKNSLESELQTIYVAGSDHCIWQCKALKISVLLPAGNMLTPITTKYSRGEKYYSGPSVDDSGEFLKIPISSLDDISLSRVDYVKTPVSFVSNFTKNSFNQSNIIYSFINGGEMFYILSWDKKFFEIPDEIKSGGAYVATINSMNGKEFIVARKNLSANNSIFFLVNSSTREMIRSFECNNMTTSSAGTLTWLNDNLVLYHDCGNARNTYIINTLNGDCEDLKNYLKKMDLPPIYTIGSNLFLNGNKLMVSCYYLHGSKTIDLSPILENLLSMQSKN